MADRGGSAPHTPGEWKVTRFGYKASYAVDGPNGEQIGTLSEWKDAPEEQEANAHLIQAAPDMEAALQRMLNSFSSGDLCIECGETEGSGKGCDCCYVIEQAEVALRKARGE